MVGRRRFELLTNGFKVNSRAPPDFLPCSLLFDIVGQIPNTAGLVFFLVSPCSPVSGAQKVHSRSGGGEVVLQWTRWNDALIDRLLYFTGVAHVQTIP